MGSSPIVSTIVSTAKPQVTLLRAPKFGEQAFTQVLEAGRAEPEHG